MYYIIVIRSLKYGVFNVKIDKDDFEKFGHYKWFVGVRRRKQSVKLYAVSQIRQDGKMKNVYLHRLIVPFKITDHINGDTLDNRKCNLRDCSFSENSRNSRIRIDNTTGFKGVSVDKRGSRQKRFRAYIHVERKYINLGYFQTVTEAAHAYNKAALKYHGEFARLNKIK